MVVLWQQLKREKIPSPACLTGDWPHPGWGLKWRTNPALGSLLRGAVVGPGPARGRALPTYPKVNPWGPVWPNRLSSRSNRLTIDLINFHSTLHSTIAECTFSSRAYGTLPRIDHIVGHRQVSKKLKSYKGSMLSDHTRNKLEMNNKELFKIQKYLKNNFKRTPLSNDRPRKKITRKIRKYFELTENENKDTRT